MGYLTSVDGVSPACGSWEAAFIFCPSMHTRSLAQLPAMKANIGDNFLGNFGHDRGRDVRGQEGSGAIPDPGA
jgi:hypothetical protein